MNSRIAFLPIAALANLGLFIWWYSRTNDFLYITIALVVINLILALWLNSSRRDWWSFSLLPLIFTFSALAYSLVISSPSVVISIITFTFVVLVIYWRLVYIYAFKHPAYHPFSLERFFYYLSFISIFFFTAAAYGIKTFLDIPLWQLASVFLLFELILIYLWSWINKLDWSAAWPYSVALLFMVLELFFVMTLLPLNFNISGFIVASAWHGMSFLATENIGTRLNFKRGRVLISLIIIIWLAVLITARWF
ncbi:MAG: hypothetical protein NTY12_00620 [Candidatus Falkowbacteria bacterium]|nr:hypothetical protein [Candidatus Falkowbacteria bacterium]